MSKVLAWEAISLDGFFAGPAGDISWHQVDDEFHRLATEMREFSQHAGVWLCDV